MAYSRNCFCLLIIFVVGDRLTAQTNKDFKITGNAGVSTNFYTSNEPDSGSLNDIHYARPTRPSYAWNLYGSFTATSGSFSMPVSFVMNQYDKSYRSPNMQIGISPTYKSLKLHLGDRFIPFSPLTFYGQTFRGAGIEFNPKSFRFAAFYGRLNKAINQDNSSVSFRLPQYSRKGYGVKIGIGSSSNFLDFIYFHAKEDSNSASFVNDSSKRNSLLRAQENSVVGTSFKLTILKKLIFSGDVAGSALTGDLSYPEESTKTKFRKFISKIVNYNLSTVASYAGQSSLVFLSRYFTSNVGYRRVQRDFKSFGTPYIVDNVEGISWSNNLSLAKGKFNFTSNISQQQNNPDTGQVSNLQTLVGNFNINAVLSQHLNLNLNYSGYNIKQRERKHEVNDTARLDQGISQFNISPSYNITHGTKLHYITANASISILKDKNQLSAVRTNSNNFSGSLTYMLAFINKPYNLSLNSLYSKYKQGDTISYTSFGNTAGISAQLLKKKNLNLQGNVGYFLNRLHGEDNQKNITYSLNVGFHEKKHSFNLFANYVYTPPLNRINEAINKAVPYAVASKNLAGGLAYNYTF